MDIGLIESPAGFEVVRKDAEQLLKLRNCKNIDLVISYCSELDKDGYELDIADGGANINASDIGGAYAALGALLRSADWSGDEPVWHDLHVKESPDLPMRHMLIPGHFGNVYECMGRNEMRDFLLDMRLSGGNGYVDRFDIGELTIPFRSFGNGHSRAIYSADLLQHKVRHWLNAQEMGMDTGMTLNPNHVYIEQWDKELSAEYGEKYIGNLLCPSLPKAREIIERNWSELYEYLADCGVNMTHIRPAPFDDGGCSCDKCSPYYKTFLELCAEIAPHFLKFWPECEGYLSGWWTTDEEQELLRTFCLSGQAPWLKNYLFSTSYSVTDMPKDMASHIAPLQYSSFVHCAFTKNASDKYNSGGLHTAVNRISSLLRQYPEVGCNGYLAYTEGTESHLNLHVINRLAYNLDCDTSRELAGYCRWYFGLAPEGADDLAAIIIESEAMLPESGATLLKRLRRLSPKILPGREYLWELLEAKFILLDMAHRAEKEDLSNLAEEFYVLYERLARYTWRTGPMRHVLTESDRMPDWLKEHHQQNCPPDRQPVPNLNINQNIEINHLGV